MTGPGAAGPSDGPDATDATGLARATVRALLAAGITEVVLAPGSRNAPVAFAAWQADRAGVLRLHTRVDERTAGFLALGLTKVGARAAVVCTSGTAVANLHPAAAEAAHAGLPLVLVTADRPAAVRGTGANQTTEQVGILGAHARVADVATIAQLPSLTAPGPGEPAPYQLNLQLEPPLVPPDLAEQDWLAELAEGSAVPAEPDPAPQADAVALPRGPRTVVVAGDDAGPPARLLAEQGHWPLLAEPTAGCRTGDQALQTYRLLLDGPLGERIERVVVAGHPTLSRPVTRLLERDDVEVLSLPAAGVWPARPFGVDAEYAALTVAGPRPGGEDPDADRDAAWLAAWVEADQRLATALQRLLDDRPRVTPHHVAAAVSRALPPAGTLVVGASSPVRDLDLVAVPTPVGERRKVIANRGLAGIDGTLSTALGAGLGRPHATRTLALVGDVTFLHDQNALVRGPEEPTPDVTIVVANDDGGSVFATLEQGAPAYAHSYERLFGTPHGVDLASLCRATGTPHRRVDSRAALEEALATPAGGVEVVEVPVRRDDRRELDAAIRALAADATHASLTPGSAEL